MSGPAVTVVESGGIPVRAVETGGAPMTFVDSGGIAVTLVETGGTPFNIEGLSPPTEVPANLTPPELTDSSYTVGDSPSWSQGTWSNGPITSRAFQLYADGLAIPGATVSGGFELTGDEEGADITVGEIATNVVGDSAEAVSDPVGPVLASPATLSALALDDTSVPEDSAATINITGATSGSTITVQTGSIPTGMTLNSGARTITGTPTTAATSNFTLRETLAGATNTPLDTALAITVSAVVAAPTNSVAPAVTGTAQVGETLTTDDGTWSGSPTFTYQWQEDDGGGYANISGETANTLLLDGAFEGSTIRCVVTGTNSEGSDTANSNATAAVVAASGLTTPDVTELQDAGDPPEVDLGLKSDHHAGYYLDIQRADNTSSDFSSLSMDIFYQITSADLTDGISAAELAIEGYSDPTGAYSQRYRIRREDGVVSAWVVITGTVTASVGVLGQSTGAAKNGNLDTATYSGLGGINTGAGPASARNETAVTGKRHFEVKIEAIVGAGVFLTFGITDTGANFSTTNIRPGAGSTNPNGISFQLNAASANITRIYNSATQSSVSMGSNPQVGDVLVIEFDTATNSLTGLWHVRGATVSSNLGAITPSSKIPTDYVAHAGGSTTGDRFSINFGAAAWAKAPTTDYAGW